MQIEKYMFHILKTDVWSRLSEQEQKFAKRWRLCSCFFLIFFSGNTFMRFFVQQCLKWTLQVYWWHGKTSWTVCSLKIARWLPVYFKAVRSKWRGWHGYSFVLSSHWFLLLSFSVCVRGGLFYGSRFQFSPISVLVFV